MPSDPPGGDNRRVSEDELHRAAPASRDNIAPRDPFAAGLFPVCVATHDVGIRLLFDLSALILLLDCRPGDRVLDLGAGSGFSSEMLARLGYDVIALDPDRRALGHARRRPTFDAARIEGRVQVVQGLAERLPFASGSFDGVLAMNVLHHVPDLEAALSELARVLRPGRRVVCSEPGLDHLEMSQTRRALREHGENDRPFDVMAYLRLARANGFAQAMLSATLHSAVRLLPIEEVELFASGQHPRPHMNPKGVIDHLRHRQAFAMLVRDGTAPATSRRSEGLRARLEVSNLPPRARAGDTLAPVIRAVNTGEAVWLAAPRRFGGYVTAGCKLLNEEGRLLDDALGRTGLAADVPPGGETVVRPRIAIPRDLPAGIYRLQFDLVSELVCWFSDGVLDPPFHRIEIAAADPAPAPPGLESRETREREHA